MKEIKEVDPMSVAKLVGLAGVVWGLLAGIMLTIFGTAFEAYMGRIYAAFGTVSPMVGVASIIFLPIMYGVTGFIGAYIGALVYNFVAKQVGGVKIDLK